MKKTLLIIICAFACLFSFAQDMKVYTDQLIVIVNDESTDPQDANVLVADNGNGTINFELQNFFLITGGESMPVGNVCIENLPVTKGEDGLDYITFDGTIIIQPGNQEGVDMWMGPMLNEIPMKLNGKMNEKKLYVTIDIDMQATINQICHVQFGTDVFSTSVTKIYTDQLIITINGTSSDPQTTDVTVIDNGDGTIDFEMKNFFMVQGGEYVPVGNIYIENLLVTEGEDGLKHITFNAPMTILPGDLEGVDMWIGPMFGEIPLNLRGKMNDEKFFAVIDIDLQESFGQVLFVQFGTDDFPVLGKRGDLNGDGKVDIADAVSVLDLMAEGTYSKDADLNGDGKVDIADFVSILDIMAEQ